jgi:hypothetical protein
MIRFMARMDLCFGHGERSTAGEPNIAATPQFRAAFRYAQTASYAGFLLTRLFHRSAAQPRE